MTTLVLEKHGVSDPCNKPRLTLKKRHLGQRHIGEDLVLDAVQRWRDERRCSEYIVLDLAQRAIESPCKKYPLLCQQGVIDHHCLCLEPLQEFHQARGRYLIRRCSERYHDLAVEERLFFTLDLSRLVKRITFWVCHPVFRPLPFAIEVQIQIY